jgi:hypothetical protein
VKEVLCERDPFVSRPDVPRAGFEPSRPTIWAVAILVLAVLTLAWPVLQGHLLAGDDYQLAGWAFRRFGAEYWRQHHAIPLWNPFVMGGVPYVGGMAGDIFYPTAWLRYLLPLDVATNLTFAGHLVIAGLAMYAFLRGLGASWTAAVTGGLAYELTGIVASQISPGHDGKLFVSAMAPFLLLGLLRGIRERKTTGYAAAALTVGLALHGHPQSAYYLLVAAGLWTLFLVFGDPAGPKGRDRWRALALTAAMVALGFGLYAIQLLPFYAYLPYSPRGAGGPSGGWEYATGYALPPTELFSTFLPEMNGIRDTYSGTNFLKTHTEYLGPLVIILAVCGIGGPRHRRVRLALGGIGLLFLLVALGGHTPFYRAWYELMPMMKKVRAAGMAFFLPALVVSVFAGFGVDRILSGEVPARRILIGAGCFALFGLLGAAGGLDGIAMAISQPEAVQIAARAAPELHTGALRLFLVAAVGGPVLFSIRTARFRGAAAAVVLFVAVTADLWSLDRKFFGFPDTAETLFGDDQITTSIRKTPLPYRVWDPKGGELERGLGVYPGSWLMGRDIPQLLGYHGQELRRFDEVLGGKNIWSNQVNVGMLQLFGVRYVVLQQAEKLPGYHEVLGPVRAITGKPAILYEADTIPPYVRLMPGAVKAPENQIAEVVGDARFPLLSVAIYSDSDKVSPAPLGDKSPAPATASAAVTFWEPGKMHIAIQGRDERPLYLVVAENWYKDWRATVDEAAVPVLRAQHTLLSVIIPPGAKEVTFEFRSSEYERGRLISLLSVVVVVGLFLVPVFRRRAAAHG